MRFRFSPNDTLPAPKTLCLGTACGREHRIAESLQRVLLRACPREALPGISVEAFYQAALDEATVGGDSYDAFALDGGRIALVIGDASGKGLEAAERIAEIRFALRAFLREHGDPACALSRLNDYVCDSYRLGKRGDGAFATLTLAVLDCASGETACLCAGGEPPLVLRRGGMAEVVDVSGLALGVIRDQGYAATRLHLFPGDMIVLVTDGLTEARRLGLSNSMHSRTGEFLGLEGVGRLALNAQDPSASLYRVGQSVFEGVRTFAGGTFHDDACLLAGRRNERLPK